MLAEPTQANYGIEGGEEQVPGSTGWTQKQQKSLETALACYTKGCSERWERIAKAVPDKTKVIETQFSLHFIIWSLMYTISNSFSLGGMHVASEVFIRFGQKEEANGRRKATS